MNVGGPLFTMGGQYAGGVGGVPLRFSTVGGYPPKCEKGGFGWVGEEVGTRSVPDNVNGHKKEKAVL